METDENTLSVSSKFNAFGEKWLSIKGAAVVATAAVADEVDGGFCSVLSNTEGGATPAAAAG